MSTMEMTADPQVQSSLAVFQNLLRGYESRDFAVRFWDGTTWTPGAGQAGKPDLQHEPAFTVVLNHPGSLRKMFWPPRPLNTGEAFVYDDFNVEGDMLAFTGLCKHLANLKHRLSLWEKLSLGWKLWKLPKVDRPRVGREAAKLTGRKHSKKRDQQAISYHYDISNEFFEFVLGPYMQYTMGIHADASEDLNKAQERKIDLLCRKLRLKPGERLLDIGCGWGEQIMYAAKNYGTQGLGVTISQRQRDWVDAKIRKAGLEAHCRVELRDYRDIDEAQPFDKILTIEVAEHFGAEMLPGYFRKCWRLLRPGGSLMIQQICLTSAGTGLPAAREFSEHHIFPDGELTPVSTFVQLGEKTGFEVRDVEGFRENYILTLKAWLRNLEANHNAIVQATDEATYRVFRLYFAGACQGFQNNVFSVYQILLVKPDGAHSGYPLTCEDWYA